MSWMSPRANALVDAARPAMSLDAARAARMRARVLAATGVAVGAAAVTVVAKGAAPAASAAAAPAPAASAGAASAVSMSLGAKLALIVLGAAAVATGTHVVDRMMMSGASAPIAASAPRAPISIAPVAPRVVLAPSLVAVPMPFAVPGHTRARASMANAIAIAGAPAETPTPRAVSADDRALLDETPPTFDQGADALARELSEVRGAQAALHAGDGATALVALDAHDRDFPAGQLAEESGVLRIEALCAVGRAIDAADARAAFVARFPRSAQRARAARACGGGEGP